VEVDQKFFCGHAGVAGVLVRQGLGVHIQDGYIEKFDGQAIGRLILFEDFDLEVML